MAISPISLVNRLRGIGLGVAAVLVVSSTGTASALVCGANVTTDTVLAANITCSTNPALTVTSATLDLNGFTVKSTAGDGIILAGSGAKLLNGVVTSTGYGVSLTGDGKHSVRDVVAKGNTKAGFIISSGGNKVDHNTAQDNDTSGFTMFNTKNKLVGNIAVANTGKGLDAGLELANTLTSNIFTSNGSHGVSIIGGKNKLKDNVVTSNGTSLIGSGIVITGALNSLKRDRVVGNYDAGIDIKGDGNKLTKVSSMLHGEASISTVGNKNKINGSFAAGGTPGISVEGAEAQITSCRAFGNSLGIHLAAGSLHVASKNFAFGNDSNAIRATADACSIHHNTAGANFGTDLLDLHPACGDNVWSDNVHGSANPACIQ